MSRFKKILITFAGLLTLIALTAFVNMKTGYTQAHHWHFDVVEAANETACDMSNATHTPGANESNVIVATGAADQICTARTGCGCSHRRGDHDELRKHESKNEDYNEGNVAFQPHLDVKCTKCSATQWWCPVTKGLID